MAIASSSSFIAELTDEDMRAVIAVAAYEAHWYAGPPAAWLAERMGWPEARGRIELERLQRNGLVNTNGDRELRARKEATELALAIWRASREQASWIAPSRERRRRRPQWD